MATFNGTTGNDTLNGIGENDIIDGLAGDDALYGHLANDLISGGDGNDRLYGGNENDTLQGGAGNDQLNGDFGIDSMVGGLGDDLYTVDDIGDVVSEVGGGGIDTVNAYISYTLGADVEKLQLMGETSINGTGNTLANTLWGNDGSSFGAGNNLLSGLAGNDTIYGGGGADTLDGGDGNDVMYGGSGSDTFIVNHASDQVIELTGGGEDTVEASINYTLYDPVTSNFVEHVTLTGTANISATGNLAKNKLTGNAGDNWLFGGAGNDTMRGEDGHDNLEGGTGSDDMLGGAGNDTYYVDSLGDDVIETPDAGIDTVFTSVNNYSLENFVENITLAANVVYNVLKGTGNGMDNILTGNALANTLVGEYGNDTLYGGAGDDSLMGDGGDDLMEGGAGNDTYYVDSESDIASESAVGSSGIDTVIATASHVLGAGLENLTISGSGDVNATGNSQDNVLTGGTQDNILNGMAGNDMLYGGDGADTLIGGSGVDVFVGGNGDDVYMLEAANDSITEVLNGGFDTVQVSASYTLSQHLEGVQLLGTAHYAAIGNASANLLNGNTGDNDLSGGDANDSLFGGAGNDSLDGGTGIDSMVGGTGDDVYVVDSATDKVIELASGGTDLIESSVNWLLGNNQEWLALTGFANINGTGNSLSNTLIGNTANNLLFGDGGNDEIFGDAGSDTLDGGSGSDTMQGDEGDDTYILDVITDVISENVGQGNDTVIAAKSHTLADNFENLTLSGSSGNIATGNSVANILTGNSGANKLFGLDGSDTLYGGAGADTLDGGTGGDLMVGGAGNDTFIIDHGGDVVVEDLNGGTDTIISIFNAFLGGNFENLTLVGTDNTNGDGNASANKITGNTGNNLLRGFEGNDSIYGGSGNDVMDGGTGNDSMVGGLGDDTYYVDSTTDKITESSTGGTDIVHASASFTMATGVEQLFMLGSANLAATGNTGANTIIGNAGNNDIDGGSGTDTLNGGAGDDTLDGGSGNDLMEGGTGNDTYYVNSSGDQIVEGASAGIDTVMAGTSWTLGTDVEHLSMIGTGAYSGTGNGLNNVLTGNSGKNILSGMAGDDTLNGGTGNDSLTGGTGADHFVFSTATAGNDTITDFNAVDGGSAEGDLLVFDDLLVGSFVYLGDAAFSGGADNSEARFDATTSTLMIDADGNGVADFALGLTGLTASSQLTGADFLWS